MNERDELLELAWGLIANAGGGDWDTQSEEWRGAAARWRDEWSALNFNRKNLLTKEEAGPMIPLVYGPIRFDPDDYAVVNDIWDLLETIVESLDVASDITITVTPLTPEVPEGAGENLD